MGKSTGNPSYNRQLHRVPVIIPINQPKEYQNLTFWGFVRAPKKDPNLFLGQRFKNGLFRLPWDSWALAIAMLGEYTLELARVNICMDHTTNKPRVTTSYSEMAL